MKQEYVFVNDSMGSDIVDEKTGKVISYKEIHVIGTSEEDAREVAHRPKLDSDKKLSKDWKLAKTYSLGKNWNN